MTELEKVNLEDYNATKGFSEEREVCSKVMCIGVFDGRGARDASWL